MKTKIYLVTVRSTNSDKIRIEGRAFYSELRVMGYTAKMSQESKGTLVYGWREVNLLGRKLKHE